MQGRRSYTVKDLGPGMNCHKKGLRELPELVSLRWLAPTHKDHLPRFGAELVFTLCELQCLEIAIIHKGEQPGFEEELAQDVLESSRPFRRACTVRRVG